ncbi:MAG: flagellar hook-length control protein FliK [Planctomycetaceae bacterium]|jgi:hypothetical protein|nr:flagellar hook-length control protein FliK [Planctomycetaceae bacterium]
MSVDFPSSYPVNTPPSVSKPVDVQTLQETFAALLRHYGTESGGSFGNTMLEIIRPAPSDGTDGHDRNQQRREHQQSHERTDFTQIDRKRLDGSEMRIQDMDSGYRNQISRQETLHSDYQKRSERTEPLSSATPTEIPSVATFAPPSDGTSRNDSLPQGNLPLPPQKNVSGTAGTNSPSDSASTVLPSHAMGIGQAQAALPINTNVSAPIPTSVTPQTSLPLSLTIFTPSGRFGQLQEQSSEEESDEEKPDEKKVSKKKPQPFAAFEAIRTETTRPIQQKHARLSKEPIAGTELPVIEKSHGKPKEVDPELIRNGKTAEELPKMAEQNIFVQKKGEPNSPDHARYLHRIAAACEAAAPYAPIRMKINLDHLGTLSLRFFHKADKLTLRFETPSQESAQFLQSHLEGLRTILSQRKVKIVDIEIVQDS